MSKNSKEYYYNQLQDGPAIQRSTTASWVNLNSPTSGHDNEASVDLSCHVELERLLHEAQREGSTPASSENSSHHSRDASDEELDSTNSVAINENVISVLPNVGTPPTTDARNVEKVMSWASHPSNKPPKPDQFQHHVGRGRKRTFSLRKTDAMKNGLLSWEFLRVFIPSLLLTNIFTFGIGYYVGRKHGSIAVKAI